MKIREYFEHTDGYGVLATAAPDGRVDAALYAKPYFIDDDTIAFIMADRLTHRNLDENPYASYLFMEDERFLRGARLYLTKKKQERNPELIDELRQLRHYISQDEIYEEDTFLVFFSIDKVLPLIGSEHEGLGPIS